MNELCKDGFALGSIGNETLYTTRYAHRLNVATLASVDNQFFLCWNLRDVDYRPRVKD